MIASLAVPPAPAAAATVLDGWVPAQEQRSWNHLLENISPTEPKEPGGPPPLRGVVVAALHRKDPDYYFHWIRDSAEVMRAVARAFLQGRPYEQRTPFETQFGDFLQLSRRLQQTPSRYGLGEPRYTVSGEVDPLPWSRPQFDGPALRALAVLDYLKAEPSARTPDPARRALAVDVLVTDLEFLTTVWDQRGFDAWEEYRADSYSTRLVQLAALERGAAWLEAHAPDRGHPSQYRDCATRLDALLDDHWDPARKYVKAQLAVVETDGYTAKATDLDSEVIVAIIDADRDGARHSVLDDRVQATVAALETLFRDSYPINRRSDVGLAYGRYAGDAYYGGNAWYFITAYYASFYYRLAARLQAGASVTVTARNLPFLRSVLPSDAAAQLKEGATLEPDSPLHAAALRAFALKGDGVLARLKVHTPADGQLYEQIDRVRGTPVSSRGIAWSHAVLLTAFMDRAALGAAQH
jgi:glucoamylase